MVSSVFSKNMTQENYIDYLIKQLYSTNRDTRLETLKTLQKMTPQAEEAILDMFWLIDQSDVGITFNAIRAINANLPSDKQLEEIILWYLIREPDVDEFSRNSARTAAIFKKIWSGQLGLISIEQEKVESMLLSMIIDENLTNTERIRTVQLVNNLVMGTDPYKISDEFLTAIFYTLNDSEQASEIKSNLTELLITIVLYQEEGQIIEDIYQQLSKIHGKSESAEVNKAVERVLTIINSTNKVVIVNGNQWVDTDDNPIHAHSGGVIKVDDTYYWFGEYRKADWNFNAVRMYKSKDLKNWEFANNVLTEASHPDLYCRLIERPKIIYNEQTRKYVMWMHWENGEHYGEARTAVAYCDTVDGDYEYLGSFRPLGHMSRDCTLFKDDDGTAYFISAAKENYDLNIYRLTDDYLAIDKLVHIIAGQHREAPAVFKANGYYFLVTSVCSGWNPSQGAYAYTTDLESDHWSPLHNLDSNTTYESQGTFILPLEGTCTTSYLFMADRHGGAYGQHPNTSKYVWFNLELSGASTLTINWYPKLEIDTTTGVIRKAVLPESEDQNIMHSQGTFLSATDNGQYLYLSDKPSIESDWKITYTDENWVYIKHTASGQYLQDYQGVISLVNKENAFVSEYNIQWQLSETGNNLVNIINRATGNYLHSWPYGGDSAGKQPKDAQTAHLSWIL